jgi:hypothetical protein
MGDGCIPMECEQDGEANFFLSSNSREKHLVWFVNRDT